MNLVTVKFTIRTGGGGTPGTDVAWVTCLVKQVVRDTGRYGKIYDVKVTIYSLCPKEESTSIVRSPTFVFPLLISLFGLFGCLGIRETSVILLDYSITHLIHPDFEAPTLLRL